MSICLTNHKLKTSYPVKYEYPNLMLLDLGSVCLGCCCWEAAVASELWKSSCGKQVPEAEIWCLVGVLLIAAAGGLKDEMSETPLNAEVIV
jgi:hypothetical protein